MTASIAAQSRADRASGPMRARVYPTGMQPDVGTRPNVGIRPVVPFQAAGMRMLPPVSVPIPARNRPAARPFPVPALDPPGDRARSHGFAGIGNGLVGSGDPMANSNVVVLPVITAPAAFSRLTTGASRPAPHDRSWTTLLP